MKRTAFVLSAVFFSWATRSQKQVRAKGSNLVGRFFLKRTVFYKEEKVRLRIPKIR